MLWISFTDVRQFCSTSPFRLRTVVRQHWHQRMAKNDSNSDGRQLDPIECSSEVLFGPIMVTFTGSLRISGVDNDSVNRMLVAALGCNLALGHH